MKDHVYEQSVVLPAPAERVFWDLLEPSHVAEYDSHMRTWLPRDWPPAVGTVVDFEARLGRFWLKGASEFVEFDPPHRLALRQVSPPSPLQSRLTWDLAPVTEGVAFTYRFSVRAPRMMDWLGRWLLRVFTEHLDEELPALVSRYE